MADRVDEAASSLKKFARSGEMADLEKAVEALEEFDMWSVPRGQRLRARRRLLLEWCRALVEIDGVKDPNFDAEAERPRARVRPPGNYRMGTDPRSIEDPAARAEYEAAIAANEKKAVRSRKQSLASELEERVLESAHRVVERWYTKSAADGDEVEGVFGEVKLSAARRAQVLDPPPAKPAIPPPQERERTEAGEG
jgi:hypothetical protein